MDKIIVNIASISSRNDCLIKTVESLINQVDKINICLNNYKENPFKNNKKINVVFSDNSLGDAGKFLFTNKHNKGYYLTCDDDIIYPPTYVVDMIAAIDKYGIVTHHGRSFNSFPIDSYYHGATHRVYCLHDNNEVSQVQFGGTGVMGFHSKLIYPDISIFEKPNMADIWFGIYANKLNLPIYAIQHKEGYFIYQNVGVTIWEEQHNNCEFQTNVVNKFFFNK